MTNYDAIIIGTGQAGPSLVRRLGGLGMKVREHRAPIALAAAAAGSGCTPTSAWSRAPTPSVSRGVAPTTASSTGGEVTFDMERVKARQIMSPVLPTAASSDRSTNSRMAASTAGQAALLNAAQIEVGTGILAPTGSSSMWRPAAVTPIPA